MDNCHGKHNYQFYHHPPPKSCHNPDLSGQAIGWHARLINIFGKSLKIIQNVLDDRNYLYSRLFFINDSNKISFAIYTVILKIIFM